MVKKLFIGLAPLLAIAAFAVMPVAAQATGHYYVNGTKMAEGSKKTVIEWGTLTIAGVKNGFCCGLPTHVTCHTAAAGTVENPVGGGAGVGATEVFVAYHCESEKWCAAKEEGVGLFTKPTAEQIAEKGWPNVITEPEPEKWRTESSKVKLDIGCYGTADPETRVGGGHWEEIGGYGTETPRLGLRPETHKGSSALHPGGVVFGEGSGEVELEASGGGSTARYEGELKTLGYSLQELINVKQ